MGLFIESPADESEDDFRNYLVALITSVCGSCPAELGVRVGKRIECRGTFFREFHCGVSDVYFRIHFHATQRQGIRKFFSARKRSMCRAIIRTTSFKGQPRCYETRDGKEKSFDCDQIRAG